MAFPEDGARDGSWNQSEDSLIPDHPFAPGGRWYERCRNCGLAEAAHTSTSVLRYGREHRNQPFRCPGCVQLDVDPCPHTRAEVDEIVTAITAGRSHAPAADAA